MSWPFRKYVLRFISKDTMPHKTSPLTLMVVRKTTKGNSCMKDAGGARNLGFADFSRTLADSHK